MSDPAIGTITVRFTAEERRLLEDFAQISGVTVEGLIREALFLPPVEARTRRHLRVVRGDALDRGQTKASLLAGPPWPGRRPNATATSSAALRD
jgi:hypothetical protein